MQNLIDVIRVKITETLEAGIRIINATGRARESFSQVEMFQHYGVAYRPHAGCEGILIRIGNCRYLIATGDKRYIFELDEDGEVALFTDEGDSIYLKRGNQIVITGQSKVTIETSQAVVNASESAQVIAPTVELGQSPGKKLATEDFVNQKYNLHGHPSVGAPPSVLAGAESLTVNVTAT